MNKMKLFTRALAIIAWLVLVSDPTMAQTQSARPSKTFKVQAPDGLSIAAQEPLAQPFPRERINC